MHLWNHPLVGLVLAASHIHAAKPAQWRERSIYQLMTDRFARTDDDATAFCDVREGKYCGGTWNGIKGKLDYIQGMGFDAVWISPITKNIEESTGYGEAYHGYWQQDIYSLNSHFGTPEDLRALAEALHLRGMYLMVDIVVNHNGWPGPHESVDFSAFNPFDRPSDYNLPYCAIDYSNLTEHARLTECWMGDRIVSLPDLNTKSQKARSEYGRWISALISNYSIDGLRIDTVLQVEKGFWQEFTDAANGTYMVGEVFSPDSSTVCDYAKYLSGVMNYPLYFPLINTFASPTNEMSHLARSMRDISHACSDTSLLGSFSENHDNPRFPAKNEDIVLARNVITFTMLTDGIPIIYQGQEQHYRGVGGDGDPYNREALWISSYDQDHELYRLITLLNKIRRKVINEDPDFLATQAEVVHDSVQTVAIQKGELLIVLSNAGSASAAYKRDIVSRFKAGSLLTDILTCQTQMVKRNGSLEIDLKAGEPRVYYLGQRVGDFCSGRDGSVGMTYIG